MKNVHLYCLTCGTEDPKIREMTAEEVALIGYTPEDTRVCDECQTLSESIMEFEVQRIAREA